MPINPLISLQSHVPVPIDMIGIQRSAEAYRGEQTGNRIKDLMYQQMPDKFAAEQRKSKADLAHVNAQTSKENYALEMEHRKRLEGILGGLASMGQAATVEDHRAALKQAWQEGLMSAEDAGRASANIDPDPVSRATKLRAAVFQNMDNIAKLQQTFSNTSEGQTTTTTINRGSGDVIGSATTGMRIPPAPSVSQFKVEKDGAPYTAWRDSRTGEITVGPRAPAGAAGGDGGVTVNLTPEAEAGLAGAVKQGAILPSFGRGKEGANTLKRIYNIAYKDGDFDLARKRIEFKSADAAQKFFTTGQGATMARQQKVIMEHSDEYARAFAAVNNGNLVLANKILNELGYQTGGATKVTADMVAQFLSAEVGKYLAGAASTGEERKELAALMPSFSSPKTAASSLGTLKRLVASQNKFLRQQYDVARKGKTVFETDEEGRLTYSSEAVPAPTAGKPKPPPTTIDAFRKLKTGDKYINKAGEEETKG